MPYATVILEKMHPDKPLDYSIPEELFSQIAIGTSVEVPLRSSLKKGIVIDLKNTAPSMALKPIYKILSDQPLLSSELMKLALWLSEYYCTPLSSVLQTMLPSVIRGESRHKEQYFILRAKTKEELVHAVIDLRKRSPPQAAILDKMLGVEKGILLTKLMEETSSSRQVVESLIKKGLLSKKKLQIYRSILQDAEYFPSKPKTLTSNQTEALHQISKTLDQHTYATHLLFGVTGSGKTEVYLQAIHKALELQRGTIMLVPEISLTTQTIERFRSRFEGHIAILHHRLSEGERHDEWKKIQAGTAKIVIGARSAIFSPVPNLGLIIVDEEHETSYKQTDRMPAYHARDVAVIRGSHCQATVILGSATPSLESYHNALNGKYTLSRLTSRPDQVLLPKIKIIDMRIEYDKKKGYTTFSEELLSGIEQRYQKGEQTLLFLNRRGYHTLLMCPHCGYTVKCPFCDISLTFHKRDDCLSCHLCHHQIAPPPSFCPSCKADDPLKFKGIGTEQVEAALYAIFPEIRVMRLDADTTKHKGSHQKLYKDFKSGKADVLIGTQMIARGLHFPEVTLVGILNSDMSLTIPDFRASETTFQLLTQVSGRSGRGALAGEVFIQTCIPENTMIQYATTQDYEAFFQNEIDVRKTFLYPPFSQLTKVRFTGKDISQLWEISEQFRLVLIRTLPIEYELSPVAAAGHAKIKEHHRLQFLIKGPRMTPIIQALRTTQKQMSIPKTCAIFLDVNPSSTYF